jgi:hypothetical protein
MNNGRKMRFTFRAKSRSVIAAAALVTASWLASARGDFVITATELPGPITLSNGSVVGAGLTDYVLTAWNNGLNGTGTNLLAVDLTIHTSEPMVIDTSDDIDGDGLPDANVVGFPDMSADSGNGAGVLLPIPTFGIANNSKIAGIVGNNPFLGTFVGIGKVQTGNNALKNLAFADNSLTVTAVQVGAAIGTSNQTSYLSGSSGGVVEPPFFWDNVTSLRVVGVFASASFKGPPANVTAVPFANIVVPNGTTGTFSGALSGDHGAIQPFYPIFPPSPPLPILRVGAPSPGAPFLNPISIGQTISVTGIAQTMANVPVDDPAGGVEVFGLAVTTSNLTTLIAELDDAAASADAGASVVPTSGLPVSLQSALGGDQIALILPGTSVPGYLAYDMTNAVQGTTVTSITFVPEPSGVAATVLAGACLMSRRRKKRQYSTKDTKAHEGRQRQI